MKRITRLQPNEVFVFGSNLEGIHGKGAALDAMRFGAKWGQAEGAHGQTYAIPTKDKNLRPLSLITIDIKVQTFIIWAKNNPSLRFLVTPIGCGLAGYSPRQIRPLFRAALKVKNVILPDEFKN